jgi:hypothetical protein
VSQRKFAWIHNFRSGKTRQPPDRGTDASLFDDRTLLIAMTELGGVAGGVRWGQRVGARQDAGAHKDPSVTSPSSSAMHALKRRSPSCRLRAVDNGIRHLFTAPRSPTTTGKVERLHNTMRAQFFTDGCRRDSSGWCSTTPSALISRWACARAPSGSRCAAPVCSAGWISAGRSGWPASRSRRWSPNNLVQIYPAQHRAVLRSRAITQRPHVEQV